MKKRRAPKKEALRLSAGIALAMLLGFSGVSASAFAETTAPGEETSDGLAVSAGPVLEHAGPMKNAVDGAVAVAAEGPATDAVLGTGEQVAAAEAKEDPGDAGDEKAAVAVDIPAADAVLGTGEQAAESEVREGPDDEAHPSAGASAPFQTREMADAGGGTTSNKTQIDYFTTVKLEANVTIEGNAGDTQKHLDFTSGELSGNINDAAVQKVIEEYECAAREWVESQKATSPGSAAILSYTVTGGITSYYYKSKDITTVVDNAILVGDIDDLDAAYLGNQGTLQVEKHQVYLIAVSATIKEDEVIELADVGKVWKELDATKPVPFTGEVNPSTCADKMALADESWNCVDGSAPIARSGGDGQYPLEGRQYSYGVTLTAKEGFVFSEKFADGSATFICDGTVYPSYAAQLSPDGKTLFVSGFLSAVTVGATAIPVEEASDNPAASTAKQASESAHSATSPDPQPVFETSPKPPSTGDDLPEMLPSILFIASAGIVLLAGSLLVLKRKSWKEHE